MVAPVNIERIRAALAKSWRQEQDGETYVVMRLRDFDELRTAITDEIDARHEEGL